jgi:hypothetical protein
MVHNEMVGIVCSERRSHQGAPVLAWPRNTFDTLEADFSLYWQELTEFKPASAIMADGHLTSVGDFGPSTTGLSFSIRGHLRLLPSPYPL